MWITNIYIRKTVQNYVLPGSGRARRQYDRDPDDDDDDVTLDKSCLAGRRGEDAQSLVLCYSE